MPERQTCSQGGLTPHEEAHLFETPRIQFADAKDERALIWDRH